MRIEKLLGILLIMAGANQRMEADSIVKKNGEMIHCSDIEVTDKYVLYTEGEGENTSLHKISTDEVFGVQIGDNPMVSISELKSDNASNNRKEQEIAQYKVDDNLPKYIAPTPSADNKRLIALHNNQSISRKDKKPNGKTTQFCLTLWNVTDSSILADENVEIGFEREIGKHDENELHWPVYYRIKITNKTQQPIYVDLANSFKVKYNGEAVPYFTNSTYSTSSGRSSGASMNLGAIAGAVGIGGIAGTLASGISVGGGKSGESQITTTEQQVLIIPPYSSAYLPGTKELSGNKIEEVNDSYSYVNQTWGAFDGINDLKENLPGNAKSLNVRQWEMTEFDYNRSPKHIKRIITYSTMQDFATYTSLPIELYLSAVFGRTMSIGKINVYDFNKFEFTDLSHAIFGLGYVKKDD